MNAEKFRFNQEHFEKVFQFLKYDKNTSFLGMVKEGLKEDHTHIYVSDGQGVKLYANTLEVHGGKIDSYISKIDSKLNLGLEKITEDGN